MSNNGWIKLHRQIRDNWIWEDAEMLRAWLDILLMVNHEDKKIYFNGELITIKRGEKLTSILKLSDRWGWSRNRVRHFLDLLEGDGMCTTIRTTNGTTLKVSNYKEYQSFYNGNGTTKGTTNEPADGPPLGPQTITNKNDKNTNNTLSAPPEESPAPTLKQISDYCKKRGSAVDPNEFFDYFQVRNWTKAKGLKITTKNYQAEIRNWERRRNIKTEAEQEMRRQYDEWTV